MELNSHMAISPLDGRYREKTEELAVYFSEYGLVKYRIKVELEYIIALNSLRIKGLKAFGQTEEQKLRRIVDDFDYQEMDRIKKTESVTNHDVKAVEYYLKDKFVELGLEDRKEFIHFALTSQDINNTAVPLSFKDALEEVVIPALDRLLQKINGRVAEWKDIPMLARTHGQPASPTRLGKEMEVFSDRLGKQLEGLRYLKVPAKFGGATGNFNAHYVAYPGVDWKGFANDFVNEKLGLKRSQITTQIDQYDELAEIFDILSRINTILIDFARDIWSYISFDYFKQKIKAGEVGSSTMPHKVNPIDFENAEGNLGVANAIFRFLSEKLPVSRLQRDLTDSTVLRNIGVPVAHSLIAFKSLLKGIDKLIVNEEKLEKDLDDNWAVVGEAVQTILRREGYKDPYETLKELTRGNKKITRESMQDFIRKLDVPEEVKTELSKISPKNYTGK